MCGGLPAPLLLLLALCLATAAPRAWLLASPQPAAVWMRELVSPAADLNLEKLVGRWFVVEEVAPVRLSSDSTCDWYDFWRDENGTLTVQWFVKAEDRTEAVVPAIPVMDGGVWHLPGQHSTRCDSACEDAHEQEAAHWPPHAPGGVDEAVLPAAAEPEGAGVRLQLARGRHPVGSICHIGHRQGSSTLCPWGASARGCLACCSRATSLSWPWSTDVRLQSVEMDGQQQPANKRRSGALHCVNPSGEIDFLCTAFENRAKSLTSLLNPMYLRKYSIERHFNTCHKYQFENLSQEERQSKLEEVNENFRQHYSE